MKAWRQKKGIEGKNLLIANILNRENLDLCEIMNSTKFFPPYFYASNVLTRKKKIQYKLVQKTIGKKELTFLNIISCYEIMCFNRHIF